MIVLFPKYGHSGLHTGKQFQHHGADATEKARPVFALQDVTELCGGLHTIVLRLGIKLALIRSKQHINIPLTLHFFNVVLKRAGITVKVLVWAKLQAIDKDAGHHRITMMPGKLHQCQVATVQIAHGRNKRDTQLPAQLVPQLFDGVNNFQ